MKDLRSLIYPTRCILCRTMVEGAKRTMVCPKCADIVRQRYRYEEAVSIVGADGAAAALQYKGMVREVMQRYKFKQAKGCCRWFAAHTAPVLAQEMETWKPDLITYVPISAGRMRERGYNQSELIARLIAKQLSLPCKPTLRKAWMQKRQSGLDREQRAENVQGAFVPDTKASFVKGKRVVLLDDVLTTGATLANCVAVLREMGASHIYTLAVTKTP